MIGKMEKFARSQINGWIILLLCLAYCFYPARLFATQHPISVVYPKMDPPYDKLYQQTIAGLKASIHGTVNELALEKDYQIESVKQWYQQQNPFLLIALGQRGSAVCQHLEPNQSFVLGAVLFVPEPCVDNQITVSLTPAPKQLFEQLNQLKPEIKKINVVYDPSINDWVIEQAKKQAAAMNIELNALTTDSLRQSAIIYRAMLEKINPQTEAIWLLQDRKSVDNKIILPLLLNEAWEKNLVIFSSNLAHVKKGILFALYPDNFALGSYLGSLANQLIKNNQVFEQVYASPHSKAAINLRTAQHLGILLSSETSATFSLFFPNQRQ